MDSNSEIAGQNWRLGDTGKAEGEMPHGSLAPEQESAREPSQFSRGQLWARRLGLLVFVLVCLELGVALVILPWTHIWTDNNLLLDYPTVRLWAGNTFVRGAFSGLGLIDIWLGIWEAVSYREHK